MDGFQLNFPIFNLSYFEAIWDGAKTRLEPEGPGPSVGTS